MSHNDLSSLVQEAILNETFEPLSEAKPSLASYRKERQTISEFQQRVKLLEQQLQEQQRTLKNTQTEASQQEKQYTQHIHSLQQELQKQTQQKQALQQSIHSELQALQRHATPLFQRISMLSQRQSKQALNTSQIRKEWKGVMKDVQSTLEAHQTLQQRLDEEQASSAQLQKQFQKAEKSWKFEQEITEAHTSTIQKLETQLKAQKQQLKEAEAQAIYSKYQDGGGTVATLEGSDIQEALLCMGLPASASLEEIKARYRELALFYSPDQYQNHSSKRYELSERKMKEINKALELLQELKN